MINIINYIDGYKTVIVGVAMIIVGMYNGDNNLILQGFGLIALRLGIKKVETRLVSGGDSDEIDVSRR